MGDPYVDTPLGRHKGSLEFRLVELQPSAPSDLIRCILRTYSLDSDTPPYTALSYTWGPKVKPKVIELNGILFPVGDSLWSFLEQMCLQGQFHVYWIDAICINQESVLERNHQVQMMRRIYSVAQFVSIWLGEADQGFTSDIAMEYLETYSAITISSADTTCSPFRGWSHNDFRDYDLDLFSEQHTTFPWSKKQAEAISTLYKRTYWSRIWIVQEVILAREPIIYCGSKKVAWQALERLSYDLMRFLLYHEEYDEDDTFKTEFMIEREVQQSIVTALSAHRENSPIEAPLDDLSDLVELYRGQEASNVLDKVYGLCGLVREENGFAIDYSISPDCLLIKLINHVCTLGWKKDKVYDFESSYSSALGVEWR